MNRLRGFTMPKWGIEMTEGKVSEWNIKEGDAVVRGQIVAQVETDKIVNEVEAEFDGIFVRLIAVPDEIYPVGALLAVIAQDAVAGDEIDRFVAGFGGSKAQAEAAAPASIAAASIGVPAAAPAGVAVAPASVAAPSPRTAPPPAAVASVVRRAEASSAAAGVVEEASSSASSISAAALQLAQRLRLNVAAISGSGRRGRITLQDVDQSSKPLRKIGGGDPVSIEAATQALDAHYASPRAKRLALEHGVDLSVLTGTGPRGRISRNDVALVAGARDEPKRGKIDVQRMSMTRKAIARQLTLSKSTIPHFYLRTSIKLDALMVLRADLKARGAAAPSVNDYMIRAAALALTREAGVNVQVHNDEIHRFSDADISVAVATDKGLITPIIRAAQTKAVGALSLELRALIERARAGKLRSADIEGGSFTVSNLGMFGIEQFDAIINPPQGAILAIGAAHRRPIELNGGLHIATVANISLSCDHRAIDGAVGAKFLQTLQELIEAPHQL